jgi:hypothetical protein
VLLLLAFGGVYFQFGMRLATSAQHPFAYFNLFFGIDTPRVIGDMTRLDANHYRTEVHPLYVLFMNPIGATVARGLAIDAAIVATAITALLGALNALGAFLLFRRMDLSLPRAVIVASMFALSTSQLVLSSVPDTSSLATTSLVVTYLLFQLGLRKRSVETMPWLAAGLFSLGVTTTNFAQTLICRAVALAAAIPQPVRKMVQGLGRWTLAVVAAAAVLAFLQKALYPSSFLFFLPSAYREDRGYVSLMVLTDRGRVLSQLAGQFFLDSIVAPTPRVVDVGQRLPGVTFSQAWDFSIAGFIAIMLWLTAAFASAWIALRRWSAFTFGLMLCIAFNLALHSVYGAEQGQPFNYFQYSGNCTLAILALLAGTVAKLPRWAMAPLLALVLATGYNNLRVMANLVAFYGTS